MKEKKYNKIDEVALQIRIDYEIKGARLDPFLLARKMNITTVPFSTLDSQALDYIKELSEKINDGLFAKRETANRDFNYIFYNDDLPRGRIVFTIAHEIGHNVFDDKNDGPEDEKYADHFARSLLMPSCLLINYVLEGYDAYDIADIFGTSIEASQNAINAAMNRLSSNTCHLHDYEVLFLEWFIGGK